ncbi:MAG: hypothetical protein KBA60_08405 [Flavobacteriales bacterium]|nr:hypothetical protein [Flavobacteriales bacterium]MBP6644078.1 hypothetical protein [Flavobacteriales bacterium]MBP7156014.1 hypothetical protein [Flavobacteriales bacterium]HQV75196.1 hypothetical protein [Flavobacteriales bacterium]HQW40966.1 hypothetical protein [Flavobacteriales bacterium]
MIICLVSWVVIGSSAIAQPDTLWVPDQDGVEPYAVHYAPVRMDPQYKRIGHFAFDTTKVAVELDYKRGQPSGIYRAFFPDGRPLIFAVYGFGSLHGDWTEYAEDGTVTLKGQYRQGKRDGPWAFRKEGIIGHYKKGEKHGKWKYFANGNQTRQEKFRKGALKRTRTFDQ